MARTQFQFSRVVVLSRDQWSGDDPINRKTPPGHLFLLGDWGASGGLLRLTRRGELMLLTRGQVFVEAPIPWPGSSTKVCIKDGRLLILQ
jgi:hypothetical protein